MSAPPAPAMTAEPADASADMPGAEGAVDAGELSLWRPNGGLKRLSPTLFEAAGPDPWLQRIGRLPGGRYELRLTAGLTGTPTLAGPVRLSHADTPDETADSGGFDFGPLPPAASEHRMVFRLPADAGVLRLRPFGPPDPSGGPKTGRLDLRSVRLRPAPTVRNRVRRALSSAVSAARAVGRLAGKVRESLRGGAPPAAVAVTDQLPNVWPLNLVVRQRPGPPRLNVLIPGLAARHMSGGPNTAVNLTLRLAAAGEPVRYISTDVDRDHDDARLWDHFTRLTGIGPLPDVEFDSAHDRHRPFEIGPDDVFFSTGWWTVQIVRHAFPAMRSRGFLYLIQDVEPGLYPWSTAYALAEETYSLDFRGIVNERAVRDHLAAHGVGRFADPAFAEGCPSFEPAVDRTRFRPDFEGFASRRRRLLFYARPTAPRNLYEMGLLALRRAAEAGAFPPDRWDLLAMGDPTPPADLGPAAGGAVLHPLPWMSYDRYAGLMRRSDVGLSLMLSPHTSYPPLEMAACGMTVVTNTFAGKTAAALGAISPNLLAAAPTVGSVAEALVKAAARAEDLDARRAGAEAVRLPASWAEVFDPMVPAVRRMVADCRAGTDAGAGTAAEAGRSRGASA